MPQTLSVLSIDYCCMRDKTLLTKQPVHFPWEALWRAIIGGYFEIVHDISRQARRNGNRSWSIQSIRWTKKTLKYSNKASEVILWTEKHFGKQRNTMNSFACQVSFFDRDCSGWTRVMRILLLLHPGGNRGMKSLSRWLHARITKIEVSFKSSIALKLVNVCQVC